MEIIGKLVQKLERETGVSKSGKTWEKQSIIVKQSLPAGLEVKETVVIEFFGDKMQSIRDIEIGSDVSVSINLSSREYKGKYYHNIDGWLCAKLGQETVGKNLLDNKDTMLNGDGDDLPF